MLKPCKRHPTYTGSKKPKTRKGTACAICTKLWERRQPSPHAAVGARAIRRQMLRRSALAFVQDRHERRTTREATEYQVEQQRSVPRTGKRAKHSARSRYTPAYADMVAHRPASKPKTFTTKVAKLAATFLDSIGREKAEELKNDMRAGAGRLVIVSPWKGQPKLYDKKGRPTALLLQAKVIEKQRKAA